ncbi:MAG: response regulator [Clostridiales bacterium]|nr:response regulator [Clostridiales bacterium]
MPRTLLIVDDNEINRQILCNILSSDYTVLEAKNGQEAVDLLEENQQLVSAVLLDIIMPVMDGYQVLDNMQQNPVLSKIPVIVTTSSTALETEKKALNLGATDFVAKPFDADIIKHRLGNLIKLRETSALVNALEQDKLTSLLSRQAFFVKVAEIISQHEPGYFIIASFDVDNFKLINDQYGTNKGDQVLQMLADIFSEGFTPVGGICCRVMADNFAVMYPRSFVDDERLYEIRQKASLLDGSIPPITFSIGRYVVDDLSLSVDSMYDRASLAQISGKGRYDLNINMYDDSMRIYLLREQAIISEMKTALEDNQFEVWLQPQYNHSSGALIGAEALVR